MNFLPFVTILYKVILEIGNMKYYSCHTLYSNYDIALNRIFYTGKFRDAFTAKFRLCPRGLTMSCCTNAEDTAPKSFRVCVKRYGYESLSNNGFEYSDLGDYEIDLNAEERLTPEMEAFCVEYIKQVDAELYETVKRLWKKDKEVVS